MKRTLMALMAFVAVAGTILLAVPTKANAFPGFARKYNFPCTFCHIQWPKLADQGNYFHDRGFMLSTTGRGNGLDMMAFQANNQNYWPIAWRTTVGYTGSFTNGVAGGSSGPGGAGLPAGAATAVGGANANGGYGGTGATANIDFLSGGLLNPYTSWWLVPTLAIAPGGGQFQFESAWVRFNNIFDTSWLNIKIGKSGIDIPFSVHRGLQLIDPYVAYDYLPGAPEIANVVTGGLGIMPTNAYFDADQFSMGSHHYNLQYFGYQFENGCGTQKAFSLDPCETRVTVALMVNDDPYQQNPNFAGATDTAGNTLNNANNGLSYYVHLTQSFGGWGATNGERIGAFALVGEESPLPGSGVGNTNPQAVFNREGFDFAMNPIPNGGLNIFGMWEIAQDPTGMITPNTLYVPSGSFATSGIEYMTWYVEADWMPTFGGLFKNAGAGSNMISFLYNQLNMMQQPGFSGGAQALPGDFGNVLAFDITDRYWLWASNRTAITLHFEYQFMINYGVGAAVNALGNMSGLGSASGQFADQFYNAEANNFLIGVDFDY